MPVKVFFSYTHKDEALRNELEVHLAALKRQGVIETWHDRRIGAGKELDQSIDAELQSADIILLLISSDFIGSDYCYGIEMEEAMRRHNAGTARVIPVILRPCDWHDLPFGKLLATPTDGKPIIKFPTLDDGFLDVVKSIKQAVRDIDNAGSAQAPAVQRPASSLSNAAIAPATVHRPRSSNLGIHRSFTDREKDQFQQQAYDYVANFFESSLKELAERYDDVEGDFRRIDARGFEAAIYRNGKRRTQCGIWLADRHSFGSGITYSSSGLGSRNSFNENLTITENGQSLGLKPTMGMFNSRGGGEAPFTMEGAAEYLWSMLIQPLQQ